MSAGFTPGPWKVTHEPSSDWGAYAVGQSNQDSGINHQVAEVTMEKDARLIAAAPELLEALQYIATGGENWLDCVRCARAAIAKATGGAA